MTPEQLRKSILQYAIEGKLVDQRREEGTGEELYQEIQEEKKKLIKEGKIKKEKELPEVEEEIPFDIPENWKWVCLGSIVSVYGGKRIPAGRKLSDAITPYKYIRVSDMKNETVELMNIKYVPEDIYPKIKNYIINTRDVYITVAGTIGRVGIVPKELDGANLTENADRLILYADLDQKWLCKVLTSELVQYQIKEITTKVGQPKLALKRIQTLRVPLPPLEEQKRIVAKIEELQPYIDSYEKAWNKLEVFNSKFPEDMKKSILQYAIEGKLVEQRTEEGSAEELYQQIQEEKKKLIKEGKIKKEKALSEITEDEKPFDIPKSWKWVRLNEIIMINPKNNIEDEMDVSFIPMKCVSDGFANEHTFEIRKWGEIKKGFSHFAEGDIGIAKITPCFQNRKSVIFKDLVNEYGAGTTELTIIRTFNNMLNKMYLLYFLKSELFIKNGIKSFTGTAGQQRVHKDYVKNSLFPLPPLEEQKRIVAKIEELLPLCDQLIK